MWIGPEQQLLDATLSWSAADGYLCALYTIAPHSVWNFYVDRG